jgi:hypothetical protein
MPMEMSTESKDDVYVMIKKKDIDFILEQLKKIKEEAKGVKKA